MLGLGSEVGAQAGAAPTGLAQGCARGMLPARATAALGARSRCLLRAGAGGCFRPAPRQAAGLLSVAALGEITPL